MRKLFLASFGAYDAGERLLKAALDTGVAPADILYLCPSPRRLRQAQAELLRLTGREAIIPPRFQTLYELARALHADHGTTRRFRAELKPLLVRSLLAPASRKSNVQSPKSAEPSIGYCRAVANFIRDVKRHVPAAELNQAGRTVAELLDAYDRPRRRAIEALEVLKRYTQEMEHKGWSDDEDIIAEAVHWTATQPPPGLLILDSFVSPDRLELGFMARLIDRAPRTLALAYGDGNDNTYRLGCDYLQFLVGRSFATEQLKATSDLPEPPLLRFNSPDDELIGIARHIKAECLAGRLDISKTVVAFPSLAAMAPAATRTFREYGLPATVYPSQNLAASPPVVAVLELLAALESGYERVATTAAFASEFLPGLLRLSDDTDGTARAAAAAALNRAAREAGIIKDADAWKHLAKRLEPEHGFEDDAQRDFARDIEKRARQAIGLAEKMMAGARTIGGCARRLKQLLEAAHFCRNLVPDGPESEPLLEDRGELYDILDSLAGFEHDFGEQRADLPEFTRILTYLVGLSERTPEFVPWGLLVLSLPETIGLTPDHLFLGGLTESSLPSRYPVDPLLPDAVRHKLGMPDIEWHRDRERFHFERARHSSPTSPWLSYHAAAEAKLVLPTPFLEAEPQNVQPEPGLYSPDEEQRYMGEASGLTLPETAKPLDLDGDEDVLAALDKRFGPACKLAVTGLERYRVCPYCFYISDVIGLERLEPSALEIEPQQWGIIVHRVLGRLYARGAVPLNRLKQDALACMSEVSSEFGLTRFWTEVCHRLFENNIDDIIDCEAGLRDEGYTPTRTELSLSGPAGPGVLVKGRLDRYDSNKERLRVVDYKTGRTPWVRAAHVTDSRTHLQLPVYCHLLQESLPGKVIDNMGIYSTREARVRWLAGDDCSIEELVRAALENAIDIARAIRSGEFPPNPADEKTCAECTQHFLCGQPDSRVPRPPTPDTD